MLTTIAIQGQPGSFHHIASKQLFGEADILGLDTFADVFAAVDSGKADCGVVAIENSLYGSINHVYDLLLKYKFWVDGETYVRVEHCLIGLEGAKLTEIAEVHSQAPALGQCEHFLDTELAQAARIEQHDTAASVQMIKEWNDPAKAAIASSEAARIHRLTILKKNIEDHHENYTRFIVIRPHKPKVADSGLLNKTSCIIETTHQPGSLYHALGVFAKRGINLSKLQSRPIKGKRWQYMFYVDFEAGIDELPVQEALSELKLQGCYTLVLGSYAKGRQ